MHFAFGQTGLEKHKDKQMNKLQLRISLRFPGAKFALNLCRFGIVLQILEFSPLAQVGPDR
jgi:hypothetical protein